MLKCNAGTQNVWADPEVGESAEVCVVSNRLNPQYNKMMLKVTIGAALLGVAVRTVLHHTPAKPLHPSAQPPPSIIDSAGERAPCAPAAP